MHMLQSVVKNSASNSARAKSTKAVSLMVLSRENNSSCFSHAAAEMYSDALRKTRRQLAEPDTDKMVLIGIAHMLSMGELFFSTSLDDTGARHHTVGLYR